MLQALVRLSDKPGAALDSFAKTVTLAIGDQPVKETVVGAVIAFHPRQTNVMGQNGW